jgi:hypothetical protein
MLIPPQAKGKAEMMANGKWKTEDGGWRMANGRWKMEDGGRFRISNLKFQISNPRKGGAGLCRDGR